MSTIRMTPKNLKIPKIKLKPAREMLPSKKDWINNTKSIWLRLDQQMGKDRDALWCLLPVSFTPWLVRQLNPVLKRQFLHHLVFVDLNLTVTRLYKAFQNHTLFYSHCSWLTSRFVLRTNPRLNSQLLYQPIFVNWIAAHINVIFRIDNANFAVPLPSYSKSRLTQPCTEPSFQFTIPASWFSTKQLLIPMIFHTQVIYTAKSSMIHSVGQ